VEPNPDGSNTFILTPQIQRFVIRDAFADAYYPLSRFTRVEFGVHATNIGLAVLQQPYLVDQFGNVLGVGDPVTQHYPGINYVSPSLGVVHDNSLFGYTGPFAGARSRLQVSPSLGDWQFVSGLADWRRYFFARPFTLAVRGVFFGRYGRDANQFQTFLGSTELIRGYTAGSLINNECAQGATATGVTGCPDLDRLIGSKIALANVELRFPLTRNVMLGFLPIGLPPIEAALFYDVGLAWNSGDQIKWQRDPGDDLEHVRQPLKSWGGSIRANLLGLLVLRLDYTKPLDRAHGNPYWTVSIGPTF